MHVRTLHDKWLRLGVVSGPDDCELVSIRKAHVTAMSKSVGTSWSTAEASVNLSSNPGVDVVLQSTAAHAHCVQISHVLDTTSVEALQTITVNHRHIAVETHADTHSVLGATAIAKLLVCKNAFVPVLRYHTHALPSYTSLSECERHFDGILLNKETSRRAAVVNNCSVTTVGSQAFRLYKHFNTTCTSKITSAFPTQSIAFAQSLCLALGFLANASNEYSPRIVLAHSLQALAVDEATCAVLRKLDDHARDPDTKNSKISVRLEDGSTMTSPFVALDATVRTQLAGHGIQTRTDTPMFMVFDRQHNAVLVADVCMQRLPPDCVPADASLSLAQQAVADMHFVGVAAAYHPELEDRRQMMINKCCCTLLRPTPYTRSVFNMLRFEAGPMLPLLAQLDL